MAPRRQKDYWLCHGRDPRDKSKPCSYMVPIGKLACDACGHMPPTHVSCPAQAEDAAKKGKLAASPKECKPSAQANMRTADSRELARQAKEIEQLKAKLQSESAARASSAGAAEAVQAESQDDGTKGELKELRQRVRDLNAIPVGSRHLFVEYEKMAADAQARIQELCALERNSKPLSTRKASAEAHLDKVSKSCAAASKKLDEFKRQHSEWGAKVACQEIEAAAFIAKVEAAKIEVASISELIAAELRGETITIECDAANDGRLDSQEATLVRDLFRLVPEEKFKEACASSGIDAADVMVRAMAVLSKIEAVEQPHEPATVSALGAHRPAGTAAAADEVWGAHCDNIDGLAAATTVDAKDLRMAQMQSEIEAYKAHVRELGQFWADVHNDLETETEPSAQSSAKRKKLGDFESAISRLVEA